MSDSLKVNEKALLEPVSGPLTITKWSRVTKWMSEMERECRNLIVGLPIVKMYFFLKKKEDL